MSIEALGPLMTSALFAGKPRGDVLRALANAADPETFECFPSYEYIAFISGRARSTAADALKALILVNFVEKIEGTKGGRRRPNRYRVNIELISLCKDHVREAKRDAVREGCDPMESMIMARDFIERVIDRAVSATAWVKRRKMDRDLEENAIRSIQNAMIAKIQNRPGCGRFEGENRPAGGQNRPGGDMETVRGADPKRKINIYSETRVRGAAAPDGATPRTAGSRADRSGPDRGKAGKDGPQALEADTIRRRTRDVIVNWIVRGEIDRLDALILKPMFEELKDFRVPGCSLDGQTADDFISALPFTHRNGFARAVDWLRRYIDGEDHTKPNEGFWPLLRDLQRTPVYGARDERIERLQSKVKAERDKRDRQQQEDAA
ncbi:hypothetical protein PUV54_00175 [Hyphococcus flavus]|uniref:Helix-turn-helix domain-containing protein n=1 Tax=Hyphococcus flavus TaxID=1866326 RepID=A0AAE9ZBJ3_9PROT|nr:hypothetical protein [Hyphococcus flavus]WDI31609.1 hypothetical protein PUV54_00175 [Hyphococcus flavus]